MTELPNGIHHGLPMETYRDINAIGSTRLGWMATSPKHYRHMCEAPHIDTDATRLGTAVHMAVLEPELFERTYIEEPDPSIIAPTNTKPRATNAYRDAVAALEKAGYKVLRAEVMATVRGMAAAVAAHPQAAKVLAKAPYREVTALWDRDGHRCRGRFDLMGPGMLGDLKTTRKIKDFSPWTITRLAYYRQAGFYTDGAARCGQGELAHTHFFLIAVESAAPFDVGVFLLGPDILSIGSQEGGTLLSRINQCTTSGEWPGMFPDIVEAMLTDAFTLQLPEFADAE